MPAQRISLFDDPAAHAPPPARRYDAELADRIFCRWHEQHHRPDQPDESWYAFVMSCAIAGADEVHEIKHPGLSPYEAGMVHRDLFEAYLALNDDAAMWARVRENRPPTPRYAPPELSLFERVRDGIADTLSFVGGIAFVLSLALAQGLFFKFVLGLSF